MTVNPHGKPHGAPTDADRHVGDLGNFKTDAEGNSTGNVQDKLVKLIGSESVLGVSLTKYLEQSYSRAPASIYRVES